MEFDQLNEYNIRNIFLKKPCAKCGGQNSPRLFSEKLKLTLSLDQLSLDQVLQSLFLLYAKLRAITLYWN